MTKYWIIFGMIAILCCGCGPRKPADMPRVYPFKTIVQKEGAPLPNATVIFMTSASGGKWTVSGLTDQTGTATMSTICGSYIAKGAPQGDFKVLVSVPNPMLEKKLPDERELRNMTPEQRKAVGYSSREEVRKAYDAARILPAEFAQVDKTPFSVTIEPKGAKELKIDVAHPEP